MNQESRKLTSFTQLNAWRAGHRLVLQIYEVTKTFPKDEVFGLTIQIRRCVTSITSNIAEGFSRQSYREKVQFYSISLGSTTELQNQLLIARDMSYIDHNRFQELAELTITAHKLINGLIKSSRERSHDSSFMIHDSRKPKGFSLVEILVALGVIAIIITAILGLLGRGLDVLRREAHRRVAIGIANERLELLRNVPYDDVGTAGGIPSGAFPQEEIVERNGARYTVRIRVRFLDDPFDGRQPTDAVPTDYREAAVDVAWGVNPNQTITLATYIAPPGLEQATTTGTLRVRVIDAGGAAVEGASVHLANANVTPPVALTLPSDANGEVTLPGAPPSTAGYAVRVTRQGYSTDATVPPSGENPNPTTPPLTVLEHELTSATFAIDRLAAIAFTFQRYGNAQPFRDLTMFTLQGSKTIGMRPNPAPPPETLPVTKAAPQSFTTNQGTLTIGELEWDTYQFTETMAGYDLATADPLLPIELLPGATRSVTITFAPHHDHTLRTIVRDAAGLPIGDADVTLEYTDGSPQRERATTPAHGQVFFTPLRPGTALLTVTRADFETATRELTIDGQMDVEIRLQPFV